MNHGQLWTFYFQGLVHMHEHPGSGTRGHQKKSLQECADMADAMLRLTIRHHTKPLEDEPCPSQACSSLHS